MLHGALGDDETGMLFSAAYLSRSWRPLAGISFCPSCMGGMRERTGTWR